MKITAKKTLMLTALVATLGLSTVTAAHADWDDWHHPYWGRGYERPWYPRPYYGAAYYPAPVYVPPVRVIYAAPQPFYPAPVGPFGGNVFFRIR